PSGASYAARMQHVPLRHSAGGGSRPSSYHGPLYHAHSGAARSALTNGPRRTYASCTKPAGPPARLRLHAMQVHREVVDGPDAGDDLAVDHEGGIDLRLVGIAQAEAAFVAPGLQFGHDVFVVGAEGIGHEF